ncbi:MAG TPA: O-antigen ligase family protein, partial [Candidatus Methylomirabilis sp.]|nr:O-antigen ligase family protein [Candidatus Methylomirabilis sp.]
NERVGGLLDNPIYMGAYQIFNLFFLALLFLKTTSKRARALYVAAAFIDIAAFLAAQSRGAFLGLVAGVGVFVLYYGLFTKSRKAKVGIFGAGAAAAATYGVLFLLRDMPFVAGNSILNRLTHFTGATTTRFIAWEIAWKGFLERPLTGWGLDAFHILFNLKYNPKSLEFGYYETWFDRAHNTILDVLAMTGLLGFVTFFAIFATLFFLVWRAWKKGWIDLPIAAVLTALPVAYFVQNLFVFDHPAAFSMSYLMYALIIATTRGDFVGKKEDAPTASGKTEGAVTRAAPWTAFIILQIMMLVVVWRYSVLPFKTSMLAIRANVLRGRSIEESWKVMKQAGSIPTPYLDEQTFLLSRDLIGMAGNGQLGQLPYWREMYDHAKKITDAFAAQHPRNTHTHFIYARMVHELLPLIPQEEQPKEIALAEREYKLAIETSPKRQQLYYSLARLYSMLGKKEESLDALKQALDFNKNIGESWWYVGVTAWFDLGKADEGAEALLQAMKAKNAYTLRTVREALMLAQAAEMKNDPEALKKIIPTLPQLGGGSATLYLDIARIMERAGLLQERNLILNALQQIEPSIAPKLEALRNGNATSIDASIEQTPIVVDINPPAPEPTAATGTSVNDPSATVATTVQNGSKGPRR